MSQGRARSLTIALALVLGTIAPVLGSAGTACAATQGRHAGLVIDTGDRTTTYCVALDGPTVTGTHLIALASDQFGLAYRLGFGGRAVCMLDGVGAQGEDCFGAYPNFWGYFHGTSGGWVWAAGSAADQQIASGALEGWSWGSGDGSTGHPAPPTMAIDDVCVPTSPTPAPTPAPSPSPAAPTETSAAPSASPAVANASPHHHRLVASATPSTSPAAAPTPASPDIVRAAAAPPPSSGGPPLGGLLALGAIVLLGVGGRIAMRHRRGGG